MTNSEPYGTPGVSDEVLGVLTGQVPVRSMPMAMQAGLSNDEIAALVNEDDEDNPDEGGSE